MASVLAREHKQPTLIYMNMNGRGNAPSVEERCFHGKRTGDLPKKLRGGGVPL